MIIDIIIIYRQWMINKISKNTRAAYNNNNLVSCQEAGHY